MSEIKPTNTDEDSKWNPETGKGTYSDKIHTGELRVNNPIMGKMNTDTTEGNRIIAEFMGWESNRFQNLPNKLHKEEGGELLGIHVDQLNYHTSWDWLMPVVEKINRIKGYDIIIYKTTVHINDTSEILFETTDQKNIINAVWSGVVQFIKWYNQQPVKQ